MKNGTLRLLLIVAAFCLSFKDNNDIPAWEKQVVKQETTFVTVSNWHPIVLKKKQIISQYMFNNGILKVRSVKIITAYGWCDPVSKWKDADIKNGDTVKLLTLKSNPDE